MRRAFWYGVMAGGLLTASLAAYAAARAEDGRARLAGRRTIRAWRRAWRRSAARAGVVLAGRLAR